MIVRGALLSEASLLCDIERDAGQLFRSAPGLAWLADQQTSAIAYCEAIEAGTAWIAEDAGEAVGFTAARLDGRHMHVLELSVRLGHQRKGVGRALMWASVEEARRRDLAALTLTTFRELAWNEPFYARLGFRTLAEHELDDRLRKTLQAEAEAGLPRERRCAMRLDL